MANSTTHSDVYSIGYSIPESYLIGTLIPQLVNIELLKLSAMGITVVVSSGIDGAAGSVYENYYGRCSSCAYDPSFPASSPYTVSYTHLTLPTNREV